ncbi:MAG TPA: heme ABC transporter ATP-binding protein [Armatimonadota bacterium]|nr:heme ABC transporter ATP-binding protein [Armatimonadota bacterium]
MPALFELDRVNVSLNSARILNGISFEIRAGEFLGVIGPNGSGKSTLLRTMAGVLTPLSGSVRLDGSEVARIHGRQLARRLAIVPQDNPIAFDFTVQEIVLMGRSPHLRRFEIEKGRDAEIAVDALRRTNLLHLADRSIGTLSGGERQRAMIARALAQQTDILFLDEPTAHLDINYQVEILDLARRENAENGKTVVVVLHDLNLAAEFCDRLIMLSEGSVFAAGSPEEVITRENVQQVYGTSVWVRKHPTSGRPYVLSLGSRAVASKFRENGSKASGFKVHVICGGGSGGPVFLRLLEAGCNVTAGVINIGDTDQEAAESLGIEYVEDAPFSPVSEEANQANLRFIADADAVLMADLPFGAGNLANLQGAAHALDLGKPVAVVGDRASFKERDFTGGEVVRLLNSLADRGMSVLESLEAVPDWVAKTRMQ